MNKMWTHKQILVKIMKKKSFRAAKKKYLHNEIQKAK